MSENELISQLTLDEKIRLFNGNGSWNTFDAGGKIPKLTMSDGPHGLRKQDFENYADLNKSNVATCFPTASCLASSWSKETVRSVARAIALEAKNEKVQLVLGPGINIKRSPLCGRNFEYFSEDPYAAGILATEYVNSMQAEGVGCSLKHYAANSQEKRRQTSNSIIDERTLNEIYLRGFELTVRNAQPASIMASYNRVNGLYAAHSPELLNGTLREKWGFKGFVVSDWGACINPPECLKAGMDLAMPDSNGYFSTSLKKAIADKILDESTVETANTRIVECAKKFNENCIRQEVDFEEQNKVALNAALDSAVLLKNDGILPLRKCSSEETFNKKIFVVGELAEFVKFQGGGSSHITTASYPNLIESLSKEGFKVEYEKAYFSGFCPSKKVKHKNRPLQHSALKKLSYLLDEDKNLPVIFCCGLTEKFEGEGFDRTDLNLPEEQLEVLNGILQLTKNVVVVCFSGSAVYLPFENDVRAVLQMYLAGQSAGEACAKLLSGTVNPSGKLSETFPFKAEDTPCSENFALETDNIEYREKLFVGYRYYESKNIPVQHEFGFGLSYTTFEYSDLECNEVNILDKSGPELRVCLKVKNTGNVEGKEIVQIYVENPDDDINRPRIELRGFEKVSLKPGEEKSVEIMLDKNSLKVYSTKLHRFETAGGTYKIHAAASVKDIRLTKEFAVEGEKSVNLNDEVPESFYKEHAISAHKKGSYTMSDSLCDMAKSSLFIRCFLRILVGVLRLMNKGKSIEDPAVKIAVSAIKENPVESLISTGGGAISEGFARFLVKLAN